MGKRELLLIVGFLILGAVVYQITAPPPPPGSQGFSLGGIIQHLRRGVQGNRAFATLDTTRTEPIDASVQELKFVLQRIDLTVVGENRSDASITMHVTSNGFDDTEAKALATQTNLVLTRAGPSLVIAVKYPRPGLQTVKLSLKVPRRMRLRLEPGDGRLNVENLAAIEVMGLRGDTTVKNIAGLVSMNHRGGDLTIEGAGTLKLVSNGDDVNVRRVAGTITVQSRGGDLALAEITGPAEIETHNTDVRFEELKSLKAPFRVDATSGTLKIEGLRTEARIDGRDTEIDVGFDAAVACTIYNTSEDINITPPPGGYTLDAVANEGRINTNDSTLKPAESETEQRVSGAVRGGGPTLTLRVTRGDINVRAR
jgi:hypothetical protein